MSVLASFMRTKVRFLKMSVWVEGWELMKGIDCMLTHRTLQECSNSSGLTAMKWVDCEES